ncbi:unnamed protein product [Orchesella dallaii]|uniref:Uncharacterized protein n=1 Tax=Orchesella dallaii TaxID=48710 RepID=A0ABP1RXP1_9HEXA
MGGQKDRELSMTTLTRPPMPCSDFIFTVHGGDIYYYHFREANIDKLVHGTPGKFVTCDVCPGSNNVIFSTRKGEVHVYDFVTHKLIFADKIFTGVHRVSTMKFHPTGYFICFGLIDGLLTFRRNFSWKTLIAPLSITTAPILRIIFSADGLLLSYFTTNRIVVLLKYVPKAKSWVTFGKCRTHTLDICDVQFLNDPVTHRNRLFSLGLDRYLVEYDIVGSNVGDPKGLRVLKILRLEETCQPTAMVFDGPPEFGLDCVTFANTLNKLRVFQYKEERVRGTFAGPVFGREHAINRMVEFPSQMSASRHKKFVIFIRGNKLGIMDTPLDGNPHKYMAVFTHPGPIVELSVVPDREQIFTIGHQDNAALQWEACMRSVEATVLMGGSGITPFYHTLRRNWGGACQDIVKDIDLIFFFLNLKRVDTQTDIFNITRTIRISEIPAVCRACGFYPSEYEVRTSKNFYCSLI